MAATHPTVLRLITLNFWGIEPPLDRRLALAESQLRALNPDVVGMQEVRPVDGRQGTTTAEHLARALGYEHIYEAAVRWKEGQRSSSNPGSDPGGEEGLAILSRHPIAAHRVLRLPDPRPAEARILLSARVETPAGPVWCHTTHLHYRLDDGLAREKQVVAIDEGIKALAVDEHPGTVQLLCGDFNAPPDADEIRFLRGLTTLAGRRTHYQDAFSRIHPGQDGFTWSSENAQTRPMRSLDIDRRIDYVFVSTRTRDGRGTVIDSRVVLDQRDGGGVCASDHYGVLADVQIAPTGT